MLKNSLTGLILLVAFLVFEACQDLPVEQEQTGTIRGVAVKDSMTNSAGITISVQDVNSIATTDSTGKFALNNVLSGKRVVIAKLGTSYDYDTVLVKANAEVWTRTLHVDPLKMDTIPH
jgi:hypothetical protein